MHQLLKPYISSVKRWTILLLCILLSACGSEYSKDNDYTMDGIKSDESASIDESSMKSDIDANKYIESKNSIYDFALGEDGTIYYSCGFSINKIGTDNVEETFDNRYKGYTFVSYGNGQIYALINDGGWQLATFSTDGNETGLFNIDIPINTQVAGLTVFEKTSAVCISITQNTMTQGYIFDKNTNTVLPIEFAGKYNDLASISPLPDGSIYISRIFNSEVLLKYEDSNIVDYGAIAKKLDLTHIVSDEKTNKLYDIRMLSNGSYINIVNIDKETSTELTKVKQPVSSPEISDGILYFVVASKSIQAIDVQVLEEASKDRQKLSIMMDNSLGYDAFDAYIDYFTEKHTNVLIEKVFVDYSSMFNSDLILVELMAGESNIDIFLTDSSQLKSYYDSGILADLSENKEMQTALANEHLIEGVRSICEFDNKVVSVPYSINIQTLACDTALFEKYNIPMPDSQFSFEAYSMLANEYCKDFDGDGIIDVYLNSWRHDRYYDSMVDSVFNTKNNYTFNFGSDEFLSFMNKNISILNMKSASPYSKGQYVEWTSKDREDILFYPLDFPYVFSQSLKTDGHEKTSLGELKKLKLVNYPMPYDIFSGSTLSAMVMCVSETSDNKQLSVQFLTEFLNEDYQRANSEELLLYKDISQYAHLSRLPVSYEHYITESLNNYVNRSSIPELMYWFNSKILSQYSGDSLPVEDILKLLEREAKRRYEG